MFKSFSFISLLCVSCISISQPIVNFADRFHPIQAEKNKGVVVSQELLASQVGASILAQGGNAIDAAVAVGFALAVTFPQAGNLGGGGFMLVHLAEKKRTFAIDYREIAPALSEPDMFLLPNGEPDNQKSRFSIHSAGVPGTVAGLLYAQQHYGLLTRKEVLAPAIKLAENGFSISAAQAYSFARVSSRLSKDKASRDYFLHSDGSTFGVGYQWKQPDLASTLKRIQRQGSDGFYKGDTAQSIIDTVAHYQGLMSLDDLSGYEPVERSVITGQYRGYEVTSMPPPSSGGVHLVQMLNMLSSWPLSTYGHNSANHMHILTEVMKRAYADRSRYLGDPDFVDVPVSSIISQAYADRLSHDIDLNKSTPSSDIYPGEMLLQESPQTTHYSVWDAAGNVVSNTYTLNFSYGSGISVAGAGFLLNNEMDDFSAAPGARNAYGLVGSEANAIAPKKRPLSSMTPTIVFKDGEPVLVTGSPGGSRIITTVLQIISNTIDFDMNIAAATSAPRIHHQWYPDRMQWEKGISRDSIALLKSKGHSVNDDPTHFAMGKGASIMKVNGILHGAIDTRWPNAGVAVEP